MDLTPVKVPGKKKRENTKEAVAARKSLNNARGRALQPFKLPKDSEEEQVPSPKKAKKKTMKTMKSRRKMSDLEKLPTELLEKVFLYCMNLDLPRSSPVIGGKLSSELIYTQTVINAFGPQWGKCVQNEHYTLLQKLDLSVENGSYEDLGRKEKEQVSLQAGSVHIRLGNDLIDLQSAILKCRWATLPVILGAKDFWTQKSPTDRFLIYHYFPHVNDEPVDVNTLSDIELTGRESFDKDFERFSDFVSQSDIGKFGAGFTWINHSLDTSNGVEIPHSLLLGPWSEEATSYLFWVVKNGGRIDWVTSSTGEIALVGLRNAILIGNTRVVHLLEWAGLADRPDADTLIWALRHAGGDKIAIINQLLRTNFGGAKNVTKRDMRRVYKEIHLMQDEAREDKDGEKLAFVEKMLNSEAYLTSVENHFM